LTAAAAVAGVVVPLAAKWNLHENALRSMPLD
jgi:hypothetical protein